MLVLINNASFNPFHLNMTGSHIPASLLSIIIEALLSSCIVSLKDLKNND